MILLDTCTLLWLSEDPPALPAKVITAIRQTPFAQRYISAITCFEIGITWSKKQLALPLKPRLWLEQNCAERGLSVLPITQSIAVRATELPWHHRDPADRIILSTAIEHQLTLLTPDPAFSAYRRVRLLWG